MTTNNHPANGPVSLDRLHQIREILSKAAAQSDGGNLGYAMVDAVKVIDGAITSFGAEPVAWTDEQELRDVEKDGCGYLFKANPISPNADARRVIKLYRHAQPTPVTPDDLVMVPKKLTAENGAKSVLSGEFSETKFINCPECFGDDDCETCDGSGRIEITVPVTWTTIKAIWAKGVEHFAAAPQQENV
ncbi:hypothetical protein NLN92_05975 [Citrobacter portucalensis]|uniref:hypothetical protein n=1 Tax=Citrobacter portucalensis TaxID=1639133 RepID=UPI00226B63A6|nr:hypothetical protein [Citrobacter portucalensis]MCX8977562.1 hypothetical protein [Citrobacter portucalensis]